MLTDASSLPWETRSTSVLWSSADHRTEVVFDDSGIRASQDGRAVADHPWQRVRDLAIKVPYSSPRTVAALTALDVISPKPFAFSAAGVEISFTARFDVVRWTLAPHKTYDWRLQFILDDLTRLLNPDFSPLGAPGLLDHVARRVGPEVRWHSRLLMYADLLGVDRFLGGHSAYDSHLHAVLDHHGASR